MAQFFFDSVQNGLAFHDDEGSELPDAEAARLAALEFLPELLHHRVPFGDSAAYEVAVRDEAGRLIYQATLTIAGHWISDGPPGSSTAVR